MTHDLWTSEVCIQQLASDGAAPQDAGNLLRGGRLTIFVIFLGRMWGVLELRGLCIVANRLKKKTKKRRLTVGKRSSLSYKKQNSRRALVNA